MKSLLQLSLWGVFVGTLGVAHGTAKVQMPTAIDLHNQRIGVWNIEEKISPSLLAIPASAELFSINLSDNTIVDEDVMKLIGMMESHNLLPHLQKLDLSNNRLTLEGVKALIPLLRNKNFQWLDISINNLMVSDFHQLWEEIERYAHRISITEEIETTEKLRNLWASKVVLLPKNYTVERFALQLPFVCAHKEYYQLVG